MRTCLQSGFIGLVVGLLAALVSAAQASSPTLAAVRCEQAPVVDGDISDACWQKASKVTGFVLFADGAKPLAATEAYVTFDDNRIYFALRCAEPDPKQLKTEAKYRDTSVTADDCIELFLQPGGAVYYHFAVNSTNVQFDQRCAGGTVERDWNGDWQSATRLGADNWTAEIAIPFYNFAGDIVPGQSWRLNFGREKQTAPKEISSWAHSPGSFHQPAKFGALTGMTVDFSRFNLVVENLAAGKYSAESQGYAYLVEADVQNRTGKDRILTVEIEDQPLNGKPILHQTTLRLAKDERQALSVKVPVPAITPRSASLRLRDAQTGQLCHVANLSPKSFAPVIAAQLDRSYYTTEKAAQVIASVSLPEASALKSRLNLTLADESKTLVEKTVNVKDPGRTEIPIEIETVAPGTYRITVTVTDVNHGVMGSQSLTLRKLPSGPAGEVKIDQDRIITLVDGKPFFPVGIYQLPEAQMKTWAEAGFNTVVGWKENAKIEDGRKYLDAAQAAGLKVVDWPCRYMGSLRYADADFPQKFEKAIQETLPQIVEAFRSHPALLAWYSPDEPNLATPYMKGGEPEIVRLSQDYYRGICEKDPYHPIYGLFCVRIPTTPGWAETYDIGGVDTYWCPTKGQTPLYVAYWTSKAVAIANAKRTPMWLVPQASIWSGSGRSLNPQEQRCQTYLGLIRGAKGILYFVYPVRYRPLWNELKALAREINQLSPVLLTGTAVPDVVVKPERLHSNIEVLARYVNGKLYLVTVNTAPDKIKAEFRITGWTPQMSKGWFGIGRRPVPTVVWFENRSLSYKTEGFSDAFTGYASHVYEMTGQPSGPIKIEVNLSVPSVKAVSRPPEVFTPPVDNAIKNPSFEEDAGWTFTDWDQKHHNVKGTFDGGAHSGKRCVKIERTHCESAGQFVSDPITLEPNTRYRLGAYIRSDVSEGIAGPSLFLLGPDHKLVGGAIDVPGRSIALPSGQTDWTRYATDITTGEQPITVRLYCRLGTCIGAAWFDDVFLVKVPSTEVINLLKNSSFNDNEALPGWPTPWNGGGHLKALEGIQFLGEKDSNWTIDDQVAFHGRQSLRMQRTGPASDDTYRLCTDYAGGIPVAGGKDYTFSVYLKGDRSGMKVRLFIIDRAWTTNNYQDLGITTDWQRYTLSWKIPDTVTSVFVRFDLLTPGILWADAAQFETGKEAHPYIAPE